MLHRDLMKIVCVDLVGCNALKMETVCFSETLDLPTSPHALTTQTTNINISQGSEDTFYLKI
jgi:hypothetical protein